MTLKWENIRAGASFRLESTELDDKKVLAGVCDVLEYQRCIGGPKLADLQEKMVGQAIAGSRSA